MPRGIYALEDEEAPWLKERLVFPTKAACLAWMEKHVEDKAHPSNPVVPHLNHIFTFLTSWGEVEEFLLKKIDEYDERYPPTGPLGSISPNNRFVVRNKGKAGEFDTERNGGTSPSPAAGDVGGIPQDRSQEISSSSRAAYAPPPAAVAGVAEALEQRLSLSVHRRLNRAATRNTLGYLFNHMRCGIYVMIRSGKVRMFVPFVNAAYTNTWSSALSWYAPTSDNLFKPASTAASAGASGGDGSGGGGGSLGQDIRGYYEEKEQKGSRHENVIGDVQEWWANGNIVCNEHCQPGETQSQYWGDQLLVPLRDMLHTLCEERPSIPDCEFFVNKRDYPHLKVHTFEKGKKEKATAAAAAAATEAVAEESMRGSGDAEEAANKEVEAVAVEPYGFIYDCDDRNPAHDVPLEREQHGDSYAPIASFYCGSADRFADLPLPTSEDWEAATGLIYPPSFKRELDHKTHTLKFDSPRDLFTEENFRKFDCPWEQKKTTALFRGTATGGGVTEDTNQRLKCAALSHRWNNPGDRKSEEGGSDGDLRGLLDAAITGWNKRDKKTAGHAMTSLDPTSFPFPGGKKMYVPIYEQSAYKYLVYIDGHCAACRYAFMMRLGSVILKVESRIVADRMWYFPLLRPWVDHVPVAADLSDLGEKILWCRSHDAECAAMAQNAKDVHSRFVSKEGVLDYLEVLCHKLSNKTEHPPTWWKPPKPPQPPPSIAPPSSSSATNSASMQRGQVGEHFCDGEAYCARCEAEIKAHDEHAVLQKKSEEQQRQRAGGGGRGEGSIKRSSQGEEVEMIRPHPKKKNRLGKKKN